MKGSVTIFTTVRPSHLGKCYSLDSSNQLRVEVAGQMQEGTYDVHEFGCLADLSTLIAGVKNNQALSSSLPKNERVSGRIVSSAELAKRRSQDAVARTKEHFALLEKPGILVLDYDPPKGTAALTREKLWETLVQLCPPAAEAGVLWWSSGSSCIHGVDGEIQGVRGQRLYVLVKDASDIERAGSALSDLCWLHGLGRVDVSTSGSLLKRTLWDEAMHQPARLDFIGGAVCIEPLRQERGQPVVVNDGGWLDTRTALPTLHERSEVTHIQQVAADAQADRSRQAREQWLEKKIKETSATLVIKNNITPAQAQAHVRMNRP